MKDDFECLRCGDCCDRYSLDLSEGRQKPLFTPCEFLIEPTIKEGKLTLAECSLHGTAEQPDICGKTFRTQSVLSDYIGPCQVGRIVWAQYAAMLGLERLPARVREILEGREKVGL